MSLATALVLAIAVFWLLSYALGPDTYYLPQEHSRWDHARKGSAWVVFVVSIALGVAGVFAVLAYAVGRISGWAAYALATAAVVSFPIAYAASRSATDAVYAGTISTGVPTSTRLKSHSASGTRIRMQPCEAE